MRPIYLCENRCTLKDMIAHQIQKLHYVEQYLTLILMEKCYYSPEKIVVLEDVSLDLPAGATVSLIPLIEPTGTLITAVK